MESVHPEDPEPGDVMRHIKPSLRARSSFLLKAVLGLCDSSEIG
jgi:hypothetical protein